MRVLVVIIVAVAVALLLYYRDAITYFLRIRARADGAECPYTPSAPLEYVREAVEGFAAMRRSRLVIAGLIRDGAARVPELIPQLESLGARFCDYRILVVENDSVDATRERLRAWATYNSRVVVLGCGINEPVCNMRLPPTIGHPIEQRRMRKMAVLRNLYVDYVREHLGAFDYLLVLDLDIEGVLSIDGVAHAFWLLEQRPDIDAVAANGISFNLLRGRDIYYDPFAYLGPDDPLEWETMADKTAHDQHIWEMPAFAPDAPPVAVKSAFAGAAIYRVRKLRDSAARYDYSRTKVACEHVFFNREFRMVIDPAMIYRVYQH